MNQQILKAVEFLVGEGNARVFDSPDGIRISINTDHQVNQTTPEQIQEAMQNDSYSVSYYLGRYADFIIQTHEI